MAILYFSSLVVDGMMFYFYFFILFLFSARATDFAHILFYFILCEVCCLKFCLNFVSNEGFPPLERTQVQIG